VHNSAARSEAAANALKSELVLRPLALPPPPPHSAYPTRRGISSPLVLPLPILLSSLACISRSRRVLQFRGVSARLNDSSGSLFEVFWFGAMRDERGNGLRGEKGGTRKLLFGRLVRLGRNMKLNTYELMTSAIMLRKRTRKRK